MSKMTIAEKLRAWYPTALHLVAHLERVRELVALTQREIAEGVEPLNWPTLRRYVRDGANHAQHAQAKLKALGLTLGDIPALPERDLVELGGQCFNSALIAIGWSMELWATVGAALDEALASHTDPMEIPPGVWRFFAILYPDATSKGKLAESGQVFWVHDWIDTPLAIDRRICPAGVVAELELIAARKSPSRSKATKSIPKAGRLSKADHAAAYTDFLGQLNVNKDLWFEPVRLAKLVGVSESTIKRWIKKLNAK